MCALLYTKSHSEVKLWPTGLNIGYEKANVSGPDPKIGKCLKTLIAPIQTYFLIVPDSVPPDSKTGPVTTSGCKFGVLKGEAKIK